MLKSSINRETKDGSLNNAHSLQLSSKSITGTQYKFPAAAESPNKNLIALPIISKATFHTKKKFNLD